MRFVPGAAILVIALALYFSRGVLDQVVADGSLVRVALLPPLQALGGFVAAGALGWLLLDRRAARRSPGSASPATGSLMLPLLGLVVLVIPYLPLLPDALPALQILAGPMRAVLWIAIGAQVVWVLWQYRVVHGEPLQRWSSGRATLVVALATFLIAGGAATRLAGTVLYPAGDEPHYLVIAQSLWRDGDFKIENNHLENQYREYFPRPLDPHYLTRGSDGEIYSIHPVGLPMIVAPVYAALGYRGVVTTLLLFAATAAALMWRHVSTLTAPGPATFAWAAVAITAPFLYNAFAVYPEIAAALAAVVALTMATAPSPRRLAHWLAVGGSCAALPWLSTKYAPMSAMLVLVAGGRLLWPSDASFGAGVRGLFDRARIRASLPAAAAVLVPYATSLAAWFTFFYVIWGTPRPQAPYGALVQTDLRNLVFGAPGLLFDQEYGLLPYAPAYILAVTGSTVMIRRGGDLRRRAFEIALPFAALLGTVGAFRIWWGGSASPGRPLASGLLLLALPMAIAFGAAPASSARRAAQHLLLWSGAGIAVLMLFAQEGFLISNGRDGTSSLLEYLSPRWPAWSLVPSFIYHEAPTAWLHALGWLALAAVAAVVLSRVRTASAGAASLWAIAVCSCALVAASLVFPHMPFDPAWPSVNVAARPRLPLLDQFDTTARPLTLIYDRSQAGDRAATLSRAVLIVEPGARQDPQPLRVLHNGRVSLPAGRYRIDVDWIGSRNGESIGLQIGRIGDVWHSWPVEPRPGERWSAEFTLPVDAGFVGLRGSPELERTIGRIAFAPISIVDAGRRPRMDAVLAASQSGPASIFYADTNAFPERTGFWIWGGRTTRVTIARPGATTPLALRVHSGMIANKLRLTMPGWSQEVTLQPYLRDDIEIPVAAHAVVTLDLRAFSAFVPSQLDPNATDDRSLGVWVEVVR
jgi:hypothetical protein